MENVIDTIAKECPFCGEKNSIKVLESSYNEWVNGALIQEAFPELTDEQREWIITGTCSKCFDERLC